MEFDSKKLGFFYQSAKNPCAVEMNLRQIKKYYPESQCRLLTIITHQGISKWVTFFA